MWQIYPHGVASGDATRRVVLCDSRGLMAQRSARHLPTVLCSYKFGDSERIIIRGGVCYIMWNVCGEKNARERKFVSPRLLR